MIWASAAAFLQVVAITSHRWFTSGSFGSEIRVGLRETQLCTASGCQSLASSAVSSWMTPAYVIGWACAALLIAAALLHRDEGSDRLWPAAGAAALLQFILVFCVGVLGLPGELSHGSAFLLAATSLTIAMVVGFKAEWADAKTRTALPGDGFPAARLRKKSERAGS